MHWLNQIERPSRKIKYFKNVLFFNWTALSLLLHIKLIFFFYKRSEFKHSEQRNGESNATWVKKCIEKESEKKIE